MLFKIFAFSFPLAKHEIRTTVEFILNCKLEEHKERGFEFPERNMRNRNLFAQLLFFSQNDHFNANGLWSMSGVLFHIMCVFECLGTILFILGSLLLNSEYAYE